MASVIQVRTTPHHRALLGVTGSRPCRDCGETISFTKERGAWRPINPKTKEPHRCTPKGPDRFQGQRQHRGQA